MLKKFARRGRGCKTRGRRSVSHSFQAKCKNHRASVQAQDSTGRTAMERGLLINYRGAVVLMQLTAIDMLRHAAFLMRKELWSHTEAYICKMQTLQASHAAFLLRKELWSHTEAYLRHADASGIACCLPYEKGTLVTYSIISASCRRFRHRSRNLSESGSSFALFFLASFLASLNRIL